MNSYKERRKQRISEEIHRILAKIIQKDLADPRLGFVSLAEVELSLDFKVARIFVSVLEDSKLEDSLIALKSSAKMLRKSLASQMRLKYIPKLEFYYDPALSTGMRMEKIIQELKVNDKKEN